jgi:zinc transporter ZupT
MVVKGNLFFRILLSGSTLLGVLVAEIFVIPGIIYFILLSFVSGGLLHVAIREAIPHEKQSRPLYFLLGVVIYTALIIFLWGINGAI